MEVPRVICIRKKIFNTHRCIVLVLFQLIFQRNSCFWKNLGCVTYLLISGAPGEEAVGRHEGVGGVSKGGALANTNCASRGVFFQTLKTLGFFGTCQEIYFSSWEEA